jgi:hypothetical protein
MLEGAGSTSGFDSFFRVQAGRFLGRLGIKSIGESIGWVWVHNFFYWGLIAHVLYIYITIAFEA